MLFAKRLIEPELLDHADPEEARVNLADLRRINRYFGGHSVLRKTLARVATPDRRFTVLDIGAASGDSARLIQQEYPLASVVNLDYNVTNIEEAPQPKLLGDAFALPFVENSFDMVLCSLFLHHFSNEQVIALLKGFYCVAREALLICDLERNILPYAFLPATRFLFCWERLTLHDGPISVRAAFRKQELLQLSREAGIEKADVRAYRPAFRLSLVAQK